MRIFDPEVLVKDFRQLGFGRKDDDTWQAMIKQPHGIILVTGPTGSGKTTTLYSTLKLLAKPEVNVCSIEDPIELIEPAFNQMQVQKNIDLDFATVQAINVKIQHAILDGACSSWGSRSPAS